MMEFMRGRGQCRHVFSGRFIRNGAETTAGRVCVKLYISTVHCKVYRLYSNGIQLSEAARLSVPREGRLLYSARIRHEQVRLSAFTAQLVELNNDQLVIPPIDSALILRMNERGILIAGQEVIARGGGRNSRSDYYRQEWVCKPV
jgi:hypothetical protein